MVLCRARPLKALIFKTIIADTAIYRDKARNLVHDLGRVVIMHRIPHTCGDIAYHLPLCLARHRLDRLSYALDPPLTISECAVLFSKARARKDNIRKLGRLCKEHVLHNKKVE